MELGFSLVEQTKIVTAASELARNTVIYGGGGEMRIEQLNQGPKRAGLRLTFEDHGPGIPDIELALRDGYTSGNGLGLGLNGARKLSHEFDIKSAPGAGHARHDHALEVTCRAYSSPNRARSRRRAARLQRWLHARASAKRTPGVQRWWRWRSAATSSSTAAAAS